MHWLNAGKPGLAPAGDAGPVAGPAEQGALRLCIQLKWSRFCRRLSSAGRPGVAPAGDPLFFASPKKSKQKKGEPDAPTPSLRYGSLRCSVRAGCAETRLAPQTPAPLIRPPLRYSFWRITAWGTKPEQPDALPDVQTSELQNHKIQQVRATARTCGVGCPGFAPTPSWLGRGAQKSADQGWRCLSEASLARPRWLRAPQVAPKGTQTAGRLFFAYFLLAKQKKVSRLPGRHPACLHRKNGRRSAMTPAQPGATPACQHSTNAPQSFPTTPHWRGRRSAPTNSPPTRQRSKPQINNRRREQREQLAHNQPPHHHHPQRMPQLAAHTAA